MIDKEVHIFLVQHEKDHLATPDELKSWWAAMKTQESVQDWVHAKKAGSGKVYQICTQ